LGEDKRDERQHGGCHPEAVQPRTRVRVDHRVRRSPHCARASRPARRQRTTGKPRLSSTRTCRGQGERHGAGRGRGLLGAVLPFPSGPAARLACQTTAPHPPSAPAGDLVGRSARRGGVWETGDRSSIDQASTTATTRPMSWAAPKQR
jgi:hypothetical protein